MRETFSLGRIAGIRIGVNWSVLGIVALLTYGLAVGEFPALAPHRPLAEYVVAAVLTAVAYAVSLLAHELGHALVARRNGLQVEGITLWLFGGVTQFQGEVPGPAAEARIAGIGPLVSLVLGGVFVLAAWLAHAAGARGVPVAALAWLGAMNVLLAVFNAIPAAPLDGGRLLQAVLWRITGDQFKAGLWSARAGQAFGWVLVLVGLLLTVAGRDYSWLWSALLGWFLISAATAEGRQATLQAALRGVAVREIMTPDPVTVPASATVAQLLDDYLPRHRHSAFPVVENGETAGLVTVHRASQVPAAERSHTMVRDAACPLSEVARAGPDESVADVLPRLNECSESRVLVLAGSQLLGIVAPADVSGALGRLSRHQ